MKVRLGRGIDGRDIFLDLAESQHTLVTGKTRSGKSVQVYGILAQLRGQPVQLCGVDPTGILFNAIGDYLGGEALRVKTLREPERVRSVMNALVEEMDRRISLLMEQRLDKFSEPSEDMPVLLVVFEEYPGILAALQAIDKASGAKPAERIETLFRAAVSRLALEGAKVLVRVCVIAQRADSSLLTGIFRSQMTQRLSFAQDDDGYRMLHESITPEQIEQAQSWTAGMAFVEMAGIEKLTQYKADYIDYAGLAGAFS